MPSVRGQACHRTSRALSNEAAKVAALRALAASSTSPHEASVATRAADAMVVRYGINEKPKAAPVTAPTRVTPDPARPRYRPSPEPVRRPPPRTHFYEEDESDAWYRPGAPANPPPWQPERGPGNPYPYGPAPALYSAKYPCIGPVHFAPGAFAEAVDNIDFEVADLISLLECDDIQPGESLAAFTERARRQHVARRGWLLGS